jgi:hypothetical protein
MLKKLEQIRFSQRVAIGNIARKIADEAQMSYNRIMNYMLGKLEADPILMN